MWCNGIAEVITEKQVVVAFVIIYLVGQAIRHQQIRPVTVIDIHHIGTVYSIHQIIEDEQIF